jgi:TfoX/Sxy family transcriptional regulator of competence genes
MRFEKSPPWLVALLEAQIAGTLAERRQMFGCPCAFTNGQMCAGLFADQLFVRLGDAERAELLALPGARPFEPVPGRRMREYAVVPPSVLDDGKALRDWIGKAVRYARSLPPKGSKATPTRSSEAPVKRPAAEGSPAARKRRRGR